MKNKFIPLFMLRKMQKNTAEKLRKISREIDERECSNENEWRSGAANLFVQWVKQKRFIKVDGPTYSCGGKTYCMNNYSVLCPMLDKKNKQLLKERFPEILNYIDNRFGEKSTILFYWITLMKCKSMDNKNRYAIVIRLAPVEMQNGK
jgi:hypothetical protein